MSSLPVLVLNSGSSSIKFSMYEAGNGERKRLFEGAVDGIGTDLGKFWIKDAGGKKLVDQTPAVPSRSVAFKLVADALHSGEFPAPAAIGHRTVCGGPTVRENQLITPKLIDEIEISTKRISYLVQAVKEYSYMDQAAMKEVDLHQGIENTLTILNHKLKGGIAVVREYDERLPRICAFGGELNQIWTNLMVNAIEAMHGKGELRVRTARELDRALVEIGDNGPGIPKEVISHIFEPFFTTKGVGEGTGLGLDTVGRIIRSHHGEIRVTSHPGDTRFQVFLPLTQPKSGAIGTSKEGDDAGNLFAPGPDTKPIP